MLRVIHGLFPLFPKKTTPRAAVVCYYPAEARPTVRGGALLGPWHEMRRLLLVLGVSSASGACYTPDKLALQDFFKLMDGARWHHNDHWDAEGGNDPCNFDTHWYGVGCIDPCDIYRDGYNCKAGRITALTLHDNNMTGSISNWTRVGALTNLTWVDLSWNHISGSLPAEFGNIKNIEVLNMAWNKLEGTLPSELGNMNSNGYAELTEFNFAHNELEGTVPSELGQLSALRMYDVSFNKLSGSIPHNYTDWLQLQVMYLQGNSFQGTLPEEIGKLSDLRYLNASSNQISGSVPPSIGNLQVRPPSQIRACNQSPVSPWPKTHLPPISRRRCKSSTCLRTISRAPSRER